MSNKPKTDLMRLKDAAEYLQISLPTLWRYDSMSDFPRKIRLTARCCFYRKSDLDEWLKSKEVV